MNIEEREQKILLPSRKLFVIILLPSIQMQNIFPSESQSFQNVRIRICRENAIKSEKERRSFSYQRHFFCNQFPGRRIPLDSNELGNIRNENNERRNGRKGNEEKEERMKRKRVLRVERKRILSIMRKEIFHTLIVTTDGIWKGTAALLAIFQLAAGRSKDRHSVNQSI